MHENETSLKNRIIGAVGIGATGIGGTMLGAAISETAADAAAERDMAAYLQSMHCEYGNGHNVNGGETGVELPGGNDMIALYTEYAQLANDLKIRKQALGIRPGIESEVVIDKSQTDLYEYDNNGITGGVYASIARALLDPEGEDAAMWAAQKEKTKNTLVAGAITAGVGAVGSATANYIANKDAPKENSARIKQEYEGQLASADADIATAEKDLNTAIADNEKRVNEYNNKLTEQQNIANTLTHQVCSAPFHEQIAALKSISSIEDIYSDVTKAPDIPDLSDAKIKYDSCVICHNDIMGKYNFETDKCECVEPLPDLINGQCMPHIDDNIVIEDDDIIIDETTFAPVIIPSMSTDDDTSTTEETHPTPTNDSGSTPVDEKQCPAENPRLRTITDKDYVGEFCKYGHVTQGVIFKIKSGTNAGTCSCTATACESGYRVNKGRCVEEAPTAVTMTETQPETVELQYKHVCTSDKGKTGKSEHCVDAFAKLSVLPMQAAAIAMEYARVRDRRTIICDGTSLTPRNAGYAATASYVACTTKDNSHFYDFKFQSTDETGDNAIRKSASDAICTIHNVKSHPSATGKCYYKNNLQSRQNNGPQLTGCEGAYCDVPNESQCKQVNQTANKFGYSTVWWSNRCYISFNDMSNPYGNGALDYVLKTAYGINNQEFCMRDIQVKGSAAIIKMLEDYTKQNANEKITSFNCASSPRKFKKGPCGGDNDDVVTCWANGKQIDFIFDDVSESWNKIAAGGQQGMSCIVGGGRFSGKRCIGLGQEMCIALGAANLTNCPECKAAKWVPDPQDKTKGSCLLPSSATAHNIQKGIDISIIVGTTVVAGAITIASVGTATGAAAAGMTYVLVGIETTGAAMETYAQIKINKVADNFLVQSDMCKDSSCAKELLKENFQHVARTHGDFTDAEAKVIGAEFERLIDLIQEDNDFYADILTELDQNRDGILNFDDGKGWTTEQVFRALGIGLQIIPSLAYDGAKLIAKRSNRFAKSLSKLETRLNKAFRNGDVYFDATAKRWRSASTGRFARNPNATAGATTRSSTTGASAGRTATATTGATTRGTANAETVLNSAKAKLAEGGESFDEIFTKVKQGGSYPASWKTSSLSADELAALNKQLETDGYKLIDDGSGYLKFEKINATATATTGATTRGASSAGQGASTTTATGTRAGATTPKPMTVNQLAQADAGTIIREVDKLSPAQRTELLGKLTSKQKQEIAALKVNSGDVTLPFGKTVDDLANDVDLLEAHGAFLQLNPEAMKIRSDINRWDELNLKRYTGLTADETAEFNKLGGKGGRDALVSQLRYTLTNDISTDALIANAQQFERTLINTVASDPQMVRQAQNFSKLSKAEQESFLNKIVNDLNDQFLPEAEFINPPEGFIGRPKVQVVNSWSEIGQGASESSGVAMYSNGVIYVKPENLHLAGYGNDADNIMSAFAHEYGHAMDNIAADRVATGGSMFAKNTVHSSVGDIKQTMGYIAQPTERSSYAITTVVGENFSKDLEATLKAGKTTIGDVSSLQKYKIASGLSGDKIQASNRLGLSHYEVSVANENLQTVMNHFESVGIKNMTTFEENGRSVIAVFDDATDAQKFTDAMTESTRRTAAATTRKAEYVAPTTRTMTVDELNELKINLEERRMRFLEEHPDAMNLMGQTGSDAMVAEKFPEYKRIMDELDEANALTRTPKSPYVAPTSSAIYAPTESSIKFAKQNDLDVIDWRTLSDEDLVYYINWRKYAPENESFARYKASFQDDVWGVKDNLTPFERMQNQAKTMRTPEEFATTASADLDDMYKTHQSLRDRYADINDRIDLETDPEKLKALREEQKIISQDLDFLKENIENYEKGIYATDSYVTWDPEITKTYNEARPKFKKISDLWAKREAEYWAEYQKTLQEIQQYNLPPDEYKTFKDRARKIYDLKLSMFTKSDEYTGARRQLSRDYIKEVEAKLAYRENLDKGIITESRYKELINEEGWKKISDAEWSEWFLNSTGHKSILQNLDEVALQRADLYTDIITSDPQLLDLAKRFEYLSEEDKLEFAQRIVNKTAEANHAPALKIRSATEYDRLHPPADSSKPRTWEGMQNSEGLWLDFNNYNKKLDDFIDTLSHEEGHWVDDFNPDSGALGAQLQELQNLIYNNSAGTAFYRANPTEISSWTIGPLVSKRVLEAISKL